MAEKSSKRKKPAARHAGIGDDALRQATGKSWKEWFALLDDANATALAHAQRVKLLPEQVDAWWRQMVVVGYEQARELRAVHQKMSGEFAAAASKTFNCPLDLLYAAWDDARTRAGWLKQGVTVRKSTKNKSMRITGKDGAKVDVNFYAKGDGKAQVVIDQAQLGSEAEVQQAKASWKAALERLQQKIATMG
jgi:hypothetical protein